MKDAPAPDLFRRLRPVYGSRLDALWVEYQTASVERKREIEGMLSLVAAKRFGIPGTEETLVLDPPPPDVIGTGDYTLGNVLYPGLAAYPVRVKRNELLRHLFILGPTGTGKSTFIIGLLRQLLAHGVPFMVFDFKRNYRCLLADDAGKDAIVVTVGRDTAPLAINALAPPDGVSGDEWTEALSDILSTSYLLMQGARNVLKEALLRARREKGETATLRDAHTLLDLELRACRAGSRRYGWLESSTRALEEVSKGGFGRALGATNGVPLSDLLSLRVVFELEGLGEDQRSFFCLFMLQAVLLVRKHGTGARESLRHVLVFDESHNVFPKERLGELGVPSRLAREVREYGEAVIAATQQADVSESLIANAGIKIILRTDYPRDVQFAASLMQIEPRFLPRLTLGTGLCRLPVRYYSPFLFTFHEQTLKNTVVPDEAVKERFAEHPLGTTAANDTVESDDTASEPALGEKERALLLDIHAHPISTITERYTRLGWHPMTGNGAKDSLLVRGLARFEEVSTPKARLKILTLTDAGWTRLEQFGVERPRERRGGATHEYWRHEVRRTLERLGYTVTEEHALGAGRTVDLHAARDGQALLVEIETGRSDVPANAQKCLLANAGKVVFFFTDPAVAARYTPLMRLDGILTLTPETLGSLSGR